MYIHVTMAIFYETENLQIHNFKIEKRISISLEFIYKKCKSHMIMMIVMFYVLDYKF